MPQLIINASTPSSTPIIVVRSVAFNLPAGQGDIVVRFRLDGLYTSTKDGLTARRYTVDLDFTCRLPVVFEDADVGLQAARAAGMQAVDIWPWLPR